MALEDAARDDELIGVSAISLVEIVYLIEKGRIAPETLERILDAMGDPESVIVELPVNSSVAQAMQKISWSQVPDMPDRVIAVTARNEGVPIISRDAKIRLGDIQTIW